MQLQSEEQTLLVADYSSLEVGILGDFCLRLFGDRQILDKYDDQLPKRGKKDIHVTTAKEVFGKWLKWKVPPFVITGTGSEEKRVPCPHVGKSVLEIPTDGFKADPYGGVLRKQIKEIRYGLAYGKSVWGFSTLVGADGKWIGEELAGRMVNALLDAEPGQRRWQQWVEAYVREHHGIYSLDGRWCDLSLEMESGDEWQEKRAIRRALNFPCQATGAGIITDAMIRIVNCPLLRRLGFRLCLEVHDELVLRGPLRNVEAAIELVVGHMKAATANGIKLLVDLQVSAAYASNYFDAKG